MLIMAKPRKPATAYVPKPALDRTPRHLWLAGLGLLAWLRRTLGSRT
jgi:hypothetical protein